MTDIRADRDSLYELFDIVSDCCEQRSLKMSYKALTVISENFSTGCDIYLRRRLSVCRSLCELHLPITDHRLDILLGVALCHSLPGDSVPPAYPDGMKAVYSCEPEIEKVLSVLRQTDYADKSYYSRVINNRDALMIRLVERAVLVEKLYEWSLNDAYRYIAETRDYFFPMCIYAKEYYPEFSAQLTLTMEKTRCLIEANEVLLRRYKDNVNAVSVEILGYMEENADLRRRINEMKALLISQEQ